MCSSIVGAWRFVTLDKNDVSRVTKNCIDYGCEVVLTDVFQQSNL